MEKYFYIKKDSESPTSNVFFSNELQYSGLTINADEQTDEELSANNLIRITKVFDSVNTITKLTATNNNETWDLQIETNDDPVIYNRKVIKFTNIAKKDRETAMNDFSWRYERYFRNQRLGLPQVDDLSKMDEYMKEWADITEKSNFPFVKYPEYKE